MSDVFGRGGGGHGHGHGGHGHGGGFRGPGWGGGWGYPGWGYADDYLFDVVDAPEQPAYDVKEIDGQLVLVPRTVTVLGAVDVATWQRQMNTLKQVPVSVAKILLRSGQDAIARAKTIANANKLPGSGARDATAWKLQWHAETLSKLTDPNAMYGSGDDLKKWVLAAYVEANAAEEGALWIAAAWSQMWSEIAAAIAALPKVIAKKVNEAAGELLGMPVWIVAVGGLGILGVAAYAYAKARGSR